jgi:hypothetical protein
MVEFVQRSETALRDWVPLWEWKRRNGLRIDL